MRIDEVFAYPTVDDGGAAIDFYTRAFGARETFRLTEPGGRIGHAELDLIADHRCVLAYHLPGRADDD